MSRYAVVTVLDAGSAEEATSALTRGTELPDEVVFVSHAAEIEGDEGRFESLYGATVEERHLPGMFEPHGSTITLYVNGRVATLAPSKHG